MKKLSKWKRRINVFCSHLAPSMIEEVEESQITFPVGFNADGEFVGKDSLNIGMDAENEERHKTGFESC